MNADEPNAADAATTEDSHTRTQRAQRHNRCSLYCNSPESRIFSKIFHGTKVCCSSTLVAALPRWVPCALSRWKSAQKDWTLCGSGTDGRAESRPVLTSGFGLRTSSRHIDGLTGPQVSGVGGIEHSFHHEHELGAVFPAVDHRRRELGLR